MLTAALVATALLFEGTQAVSVIARNVPAAEVPPARASETPEGEAPGGETRRVCRFERATGSTLQRRVCRDVPRVTHQNQEVREFMREHQRWDPPSSG